VQDVLYIEAVEQALTLLHPLRIDLLKQMDVPRTCPELAKQFGTTPQKIYYHVKALEKADLVERVGERQVRGAVEGSYQARARSYWMAPSLVGQIGGSQRTQDQSSLCFLLNLAEMVQADVGHLGQRSEAGAEVPSLGMSAQVYLPDGGRRADFMRDVQAMVQTLAERYGLPLDEAEQDVQGALFKLVLACYPTDEE
jgi:predicted ArsR family transcriptional regulator